MQAPQSCCRVVVPGSGALTTAPPFWPVQIGGASFGAEPVSHAMHKRGALKYVYFEISCYYRPLATRYIGIVL